MLRKPSYRKQILDILIKDELNKKSFNKIDVLLREQQLNYISKIKHNKTIVSRDKLREVLKNQCKELASMRSCLKQLKNSVDF